MGIVPKSKNWFDANPSAKKQLKKLMSKNRNKKVTIPKILLFDVETSPILGLFWRLGKQYVGPNQIIDDWSFLSWSAKWLYEPKVMGGVVSPDQAENREDGEIIGDLWDLLDSADIIIGHNAKSFDNKKSNTRFIMNGLPPVRPYQVIDTLLHSRSNFDFSSNQLNYLGQLLVNKKKIETDYKLWKRCVGLFGKTEARKALREMLKYNKRDVTLLEEVYLELRPWMKSHPNLGLYMDLECEVCANCGSTNLKYTGKYYTPAGRFKAYRCECNAIGRRRFSDLSTTERKNLTISVAR